MERVFCPYCEKTKEKPEGVEMALREMRQHRNKESVFVQYICNECKACTPLKSGANAEEAKKNAIKAAQTLQMNKEMQKPLTWWEVCKDDCFIENKGEKIIKAAILRSAFVTEGFIASCDYAMFSTCDEDNVEYNASDYDYTWRAWKYRPDDAERAAAKWAETETAVKKCDADTEIPPKKCDAPAAAKRAMLLCDNRITVSGYLEKGMLTVTHKVSGMDMYEGILNVWQDEKRMDKLPVMVPGDLLASANLDLSTKIELRGQIRMHNKIVNDCSILQHRIYAQEIRENRENGDLDIVELEGVVNRQPSFFTSPLGKQNCKFSLEVDRGNGKFDYISCVAWDDLAPKAEDLRVGEWVRLVGKLQSFEKQITSYSGQKTKVLLQNVAVVKLKGEQG